MWRPVHVKNLFQVFYSYYKMKTLLNFTFSIFFMFFEKTAVTSNYVYPIYPSLIRLFLMHSHTLIGTLKMQKIKKRRWKIDRTLMCVRTGADIANVVVVKRVLNNLYFIFTNNFFFLLWISWFMKIKQIFTDVFYNIMYKSNCKL